MQIYYIHMTHFRSNGANDKVQKCKFTHVNQKNFRTKRRNVKRNSLDITQGKNMIKKKWECETIQAKLNLPMEKLAARALF